MLSNAYFLAKFRFDTAENEPAKNLQNEKFVKNLNFAKFANSANFVLVVREAVDDDGLQPRRRCVGGPPSRHRLVVEHELLDLSFSSLFFLTFHYRLANFANCAPFAKRLLNFHNKC